MKLSNTNKRILMICVMAILLVSMLSVTAFAESGDVAEVDVMISLLHVQALRRWMIWHVLSEDKKRCRRFLKLSVCRQKH